MALDHVNFPQYYDGLNNKKYLKFHMLEVTEFSIDFQSFKDQIKSNLFIYN